MKWILFLALALISAARGGAQAPQGSKDMNPLERLAKERLVQDLKLEPASELMAFITAQVGAVDTSVDPAPPSADSAWESAAPVSPPKKDWESSNNADFGTDDNPSDFTKEGLASDFVDENAIKRQEMELIRHILNELQDKITRDRRVVQHFQSPQFGNEVAEKLFTKYCHDPDEHNVAFCNVGRKIAAMLPVTHHDTPGSLSPPPPPNAAAPATVTPVPASNNATAASTKPTETPTTTNAAAPANPTSAPIVNASATNVKAFLEVRSRVSARLKRRMQRARMLEVPKETEDIVEGYLVPAVPEAPNMLPIAILDDGAATVAILTTGLGAQLLTQLGQRIVVKGLGIATPQGAKSIEIHSFKICSFRRSCTAKVGK